MSPILDGTEGRSAWPPDPSEGLPTLILVCSACRPTRNILVKPGAGDMPVPAQCRHDMVPARASSSEVLDIGNRKLLLVSRTPDLTLFR